MKIIPIILLLFIGIQCKGQLPIGLWDADILIGKAFNWTNYDLPIPESTKSEIFEQLYLYENTNYIASTLDEFKSWHIKNIHLIDIDLDGDFDVIYDGVAGGYEVGFVDLYQNVNGIIKKVYRGVGRTCHFNQKKGKLIIQKYPCCDQKLNILETISIDYKTWNIEESDTIEVFVGRGEIMGDSILPQKVNPKDTSEILKESTLHWSPNHNDFDILKVCNNNQTNIIMKIPAGKKGQVLWSSKDSNWLFVKIFNTKELQNLCIGHNKDLAKASNINTYGWIKKDQIKSR